MVRRGDRCLSLCMGWSCVAACLGDLGLGPPAWGEEQRPQICSCLQLRHPHQQILGERKKTQKTEKPDVAVPPHSSLEE